MTTIEIATDSSGGLDLTADGSDDPVEVKRGILAVARADVSEVGRRARQAADRLPAAFDLAQSGVATSVTRLQTLPDSALRMLAATSLGLGAGLRLAGAPRLVTLASLAPASLLGFAIVSRPRRTHQSPLPARP